MAHRPLPAGRRRRRSCALLGLIAGVGRRGRVAHLAACGATACPFGEKDPQFGMDISFFAFDLPWYRFVLGFGSPRWSLSPDRRRAHALPVRRAAAAGVRGERATPRPRGAPVGAARRLRAAQGGRLLARPVRPGRRASTRSNKTGFTGLTYTDVNAVLPAKTILAFIALICAGAVLRQHLSRRTWLLPGDRPRPAGALGAPDRRDLPGDRPAVPGHSRTSRPRKRRTSSATSTRPATAYGIDDGQGAGLPGTTRR